MIEEAEPKNQVHPSIKDSQIFEIMESESSKSRSIDSQSESGGTYCSGKLQPMKKINFRCSADLVGHSNDSE